MLLKQCIVGVILDVDGIAGLHQFSQDLPELCFLDGGNSVSRGNGIGEFPEEIVVLSWENNKTEGSISLSPELERRHSARSLSTVQVL